jgi:hypothetical protein
LMLIIRLMRVSCSEWQSNNTLQYMLRMSDLFVFLFVWGFFCLVF